MFIIGKKLVGSLIVLFLMVFLVSCNLPVGGAGPESGESDSSEPEIVSLLGSAEAPTLDPHSDRDPCLDGNWVMPKVELDLFVVAIFPIPGLRVTRGQLTMSFADHAFTYAGDYDLHMDVKEDEYAEATSIFTSGGLYATEANSTIIFDLAGEEAQVLSWTAYSNGQSFVLPGGGPQISILPPDRAPYRCTATNLEIDVNTHIGPRTMFYQR